jgi:hypothetical protein
MMRSLAQGEVFMLMDAAILATIPAVTAEPITGKVVSVHDNDTL